MIHIQCPRPYYFFTGNQPTCELLFLLPRLRVQNRHVTHSEQIFKATRSFSIWNSSRVISGTVHTRIQKFYIPMDLFLRPGLFQSDACFIAAKGNRKRQNTYVIIFFRINRNSNGEGSHNMAVDFIYFTLYAYLLHNGLPAPILKRVCMCLYLHRTL